MLEISEADESFSEEDAVQELCTFMLAVCAAAIVVVVVIIIIRKAF
jgi:hypothetical protein